MNQRIVIFQDSVKLATSPTMWGEVDMLTNELARIIVRPPFEPRVVDPSSASRTLLWKLNLREFSSIVDLSGLLAERVGRAALSTNVVSSFRLSRLRMISSPRMDGSGFLSTLNTDEIKSLMQSLDTSRVLILDDVAWSGRTISEAISLLGLSKFRTTAGLITLNIGDFGENRRGPLRLQSEGVSFVFGEFVISPEEDGFHLNDFFRLPDIPRAFDAIIEIQRAREKGWDNDVRNLLEKNRELLFPTAIPSEAVEELAADGRMSLSGGIRPNSFFDTNPTNWIMPSFARRVSSQDLSDSKSQIVPILEQLNGITREGKVEREKEAVSASVESSIMRGVERL